MQILIATHNRWKSQLFTPVFHDHGFDVFSLADFSFDWGKPVEDGETVIANALAKAHHYHSRINSWVFADDTGLEISALNGEPGVQTRRWGGKFPEKIDSQVWLDYLLERMRFVPLGERFAQFIDGWALMTPDGDAYTHELRVTFEIAEKPIRPLTPDSPIMAVAMGLPDNPDQIFAEARKRWAQWGILDQLLDTNKND